MASIVPPYNPIGCPPGLSRDTKDFQCKLRHQLDCKPGLVKVEKAGKWKGIGPRRTFDINYSACMKPVAVSQGNLKTGGIPTWSLPCQTTCPGKTPFCERYCYAHKAEIAYPQVLASRRRNLWASKQPEFVPWMNKEIKKMPHKYFRIHESGDFYNEEYLLKWLDIAQANPDKIFLAYTKNCGWPVLRKTPDNFRVICSIWPDSPEAHRKLKMRKAYVFDPTGKKMPTYPVPKESRLCPALKEHSTTCEECKMCWDAPVDVAFTLH